MANNKFMVRALLLQREKTINTARSAINSLFVNYIRLNGVLELLDSINRLLENDKNPLILPDIEKKNTCQNTDQNAYWNADTHWTAECKPNIIYDDNYGVLSDGLGRITITSQRIETPNII